MNKVFYFFLALAVLTFTQCSETPGSDNHTQTVDPPKPDEGYPGVAPPINDPLDFDHSENRDIWQQPQLVIELLGDLNDKVVADIGAGPYGYFSLRLAQQELVRKVIAIDIEQKAIDRIEHTKRILPLSAQEKLETRLVPPDNPKLEAGEVDVVLIVNTCMYFEDRLAYFQSLIKGIAPGGRLVIIDFKKKNTPVGPPIEERIALGQLERELLIAGYKRVVTDDKTLSYQYIITAQN